MRLVSVGDVIARPAHQWWISVTSDAFGRLEWLLGNVTVSLDCDWLGDRDSYLSFGVPVRQPAPNFSKRNLVSPIYG